MNSNTLITHSLTGQHFGYSAADLADLGASEYTLVTILVDESGSTAPFKDEMEKCIQEVVKACKFSPRSDYLMIRLVAFKSNMREIHGFKQLVDCDIANYDGCLQPGGTTLLFTTVKNAVDATNDYGNHLNKNDYDVNAIIFILTDGMDNESGNTDAKTVGESLRKIMKDEYLESVLSILVGVGIGQYSDVNTYLNTFKDQAGLNQYIEIKDANEKTLAKLAAFISKSISSQSTALGTGSSSKPLIF
jgi:hypothetical protein